MKNYYEILGVDKNADANTIKNAYLFKMKKYHPDVYMGDKLFAEQKTMELNIAYDTLKDDNLRKEYDSKLFRKSKYNDFKQSVENFFSNAKKSIKKLLSKKNKREKKFKTNKNYD